jgi:hypothetical protein
MSEYNLFAGAARSGRSAVLAVALAVACRTGPAVRPSELRPCPDTPVDTAGWQTIETAEFTSILPASFTRDTTLRCIHGGEVWNDGPRSFGYCYGTFGRVTPLGSQDECGLAVLGEPARVTRQHAREDGTWHWSVVRLGSDVRVALRGMSPHREDEAIVLRAVRSARRSALPR